jgi:hypothetical protein
VLSFFKIRPLKPLGACVKYTRTLTMHAHHFLTSCARAQITSLDRFLCRMAHSTQFPVKKCLWGSQHFNQFLRDSFSPNPLNFDTSTRHIISLLVSPYVISETVTLTLKSVLQYLLETPPNKSIPCTWFRASYVTGSAGKRSFPLPITGKRSVMLSNIAVTVQTINDTTKPHINYLQEIGYAESIEDIISGL